MKKTGAIFLVIVGFVMSMCAAPKPTTRSFPTPPPSGPIPAVAHPTVARMGYGEGREPLFYYTEGLKRSSIYGDREQAARLFDRAIELDTTHSPSYYAAAANIAPLDPELALEYSREASRLDTTNTWYRGQLGNLLVLNRHYNEAMQTYTRLIKEAPENPDNYRMLAALYEVTGRPLIAMTTLDSAQLKFGNLPEILGYKRELYIKQQMFDKAIETSRELINEYPFEYENYLVMGDLYLAQGRDSLALASITRAQELNPTGVDVQLTLANYHRNQGDMQNFFAAAKRVMRSEEMDPQRKIMFFKDITRDVKFYAENYIQISDLSQTLMLQYPTNWEIVDLYAGNLIISGQTDEGLNVYKSYLTDTTSFIAPYDMILSGEVFLGRIDSVNKYSTMAIEKFPDNIEMYLRRGDALTYMKRHDEALGVYDAALGIADNDSLRSVVHTYIGTAYHEQKQHRKSFKSFETAIKLDPDNILALNNYAYFLSLQKKDLEKALEMAARVMELEPGNPSYIDTYGWVLYTMGRYEEAKKILQQAVSLDTRQSGEVLVHYGDVLYELGDYFMAKLYWEKALEAGYDEGEIERRMSKLEGK